MSRTTSTDEVATPWHRRARTGAAGDPRRGSVLDRLPPHTSPTPRCRAEHRPAVRRRRAGDRGPDGHRPGRDPGGGARRRARRARAGVPHRGERTAPGHVGGRIATGLAGPRQLGAGRVRDWLLRVRIVSGHAHQVTSGGVTVKDVTGYDLCRLLTGSWGTLGVLTEVTLKLRPIARTRTWFVHLDPVPDLDRRLFRPAALFTSGVRTHVLLEGHPDDVAAQAARCRPAAAEPPTLPATARAAVDPAQLPALVAAVERAGASVASQDAWACATSRARRCALAACVPRRRPRWGAARARSGQRLPAFGSAARPQRWRRGSRRPWIPMGCSPPGGGSSDRPTTTARSSTPISSRSACSAGSASPPAPPTRPPTSRNTARGAGSSPCGWSTVGELSLTDPDVADSLETCVQCRACEVVCPSLVEFGPMMETARSELARRTPPVGSAAWRTGSGSSRWHGVGLLRVGVLGLAVLQLLRLDRVLPDRLRPARRVRVRDVVRPYRSPPPPGSRGDAFVFRGCVMDAMFRDVHQAVADVVGGARLHARGSSRHRRAAGRCRPTPVARTRPTRSPRPPSTPTPAPRGRSSSTPRAAVER
jgi:hypothetical protein